MTATGLRNIAKGICSVLACIIYWTVTHTIAWEAIIPVVLIAAVLYYMGALVLYLATMGQCKREEKVETYTVPLLGYLGDHTWATLRDGKVRETHIYPNSITYSLGETSELTYKKTRYRQVVEDNIFARLAHGDSDPEWKVWYERPTHITLSAIPYNRIVNNCQESEVN